MHRKLDTQHINLLPYGRLHRRSDGILVDYFEFSGTKEVNASAVISIEYASGGLQAVPSSSAIFTLPSSLNFVLTFNSPLATTPQHLLQVKAISRKEHKNGECCYSTV